jgi:hypothetical protein
MTPSLCENKSWYCAWNQALMDWNHSQCQALYVEKHEFCAWDHELCSHRWVVGGVVKKSICKAWTLCLRSITCAGRYRWWWIICGFWVTWEVVWGLLRIWTDQFEFMVEGDKLETIGRQTSVWEKGQVMMLPCRRYTSLLHGKIGKMVETLVNMHHWQIVYREYVPWPHLHIFTPGWVCTLIIWDCVSQECAHHWALHVAQALCSCSRSLPHST